MLRTPYLPFSVAVPDSVFTRKNSLDGEFDGVTEDTEADTSVAVSVQVNEVMNVSNTTVSDTVALVGKSEIPGGYRRQNKTNLCYKQMIDVKK